MEVNEKEVDKKEVDISNLIEEVQKVSGSIPVWFYIMMWAIGDMHKRFLENPDAPEFYKVSFPHTTIPLFERSQAIALEEVWRKSFGKQTNDSGGITNSSEQSGGALGSLSAVLPPPLDKLPEGSVLAGKLEQRVIDSITPDTFSPDAWYKWFNDTLDPLAKELEELSRDYGLVMLETQLPDIHGAIPTPFGIPIPFQIPSKTILPSINALLEILRLFVSTFPFVGTIASLPFTFALFLLDLGKGNLYHAILTMIGIAGSGGIFIGIIMKLFVSAMMLIDPKLRKEAMDVNYKVSKSIFLGVLLNVFGTMAPDQIRLPLNKLSEAVLKTVKNFNEMTGKAKENVEKGSAGMVRLDVPTIDIKLVPSFSDLSSVQRLVQQPEVFCQPEIATLIEEVRTIPPLALLFDLFNIPRKDSEEFVKACASVDTSKITAELVPKLEVKDPISGTFVPLANKNPTEEKPIEENPTEVKPTEVNSNEVKPTEVKKGGGILKLVRTSKSFKQKKRVSFKNTKKRK